MNAIRSNRLQALPPFLFDEIDRKKRERIAAGADVINLGVGDPDQPTPAFIVDEMNRAMRELINQQYPAVGGGLKIFREAAARFMHKRFGVTVDPMRHIVALLGSKDGIAHLPLGVTNPGDGIIVPNPAYPVYEIGAVLAECRVIKSPVRRETGWKPTFAGGAMEGVDIAALKASGTRPRLLWINYPSNPCSSSADVSFYERVIEFCNGAAKITGSPLIAASDLAYSELYLDGPSKKPPSLWQARNASIDETHAIEFHSLSKTFNMTGWRIGFAVGHADIIGALNTVKSNMDSGTFNAIQAAGALALDGHDGPEVERMRSLYRDRRDALVPGLRAIGCEVDVPDAGFFVWARTPPLPKGRNGECVDSMTFAAKLLEQADVVVVPGAGFSPAGREYFRVALTVDSPRLREATDRMKRIEW